MIRQVRRNVCFVGSVFHCNRLAKRFRYPNECVLDVCPRQGCLSSCPQCPLHLYELHSLFMGSIVHLVFGAKHLKTKPFVGWPTQVFSCRIMLIGHISFRYLCCRSVMVSILVPIWFVLLTGIRNLIK